MGEHLDRVLQGLAPEHRHELLQDGGGDDGAPGDESPDLVEQAHDPRHVGGRPADGELVAADMEVDGRELVLDEAQGFVMTAEGLDHLIGVVEQDYLRPQPW